MDIFRIFKKNELISSSEKQCRKLSDKITELGLISKFSMSIADFLVNTTLMSLLRDRASLTVASELSRPVYLVKFNFLDRKPIPHPISITSFLG